jgi:hypothetical protein
MHNFKRNKQVSKNAPVLSQYSASRSVSNKVYFIKTGLQHLSDYIATLKSPAECSCQRAYKKLALAHSAIY